MGEEDKVTEVAATVSNGTAPDADKGTATENKVDGKDGISEIEKDGKDDTNVEKMDIDEPKVKQSKESKSNGEQEQEEKDGNKDQKKEDPKNEAEEKSEAQADEGKGDVVDEKLEASKEERDQPEEEKEGEVEEDDKVIEVAATVSNGTALDADKLIETATENKVDGKDGISEIEKDAEDNNIEKMDIDEPEIKQSKESKNNGEQEQEEKDENKEQEKENPKIEAKEEKSEAQAGKGNDGMVDEKLDASKDEKDQPEEENEGEVDKEKKKEDSTKKNARAKGTGKKDNKKEVRKEKEEPKTPLMSSTDRPVRERKSVERLVASTEKETAREFHIEKGRGTALKDIPNAMTFIPSSSSMNIRDLLDKSQLTGPNFKSWYRKLRLVLECENLLDIIDQPAPAPPAPDESAEIKAAYNRYIADRTTVRCIMLSSMTEELGRRYDEDQPDVMIKKLSESYGTSEKTERFSLTRILFNEKMKDGQSVGEHSRHLISISERLAAFGMVLPKDMVQDLILHSLPLSFKGFITTLNMMDIDHTLDRLIGLLIEYERENGLLKTNTPIVNLVTNVPGSSSSSKRKCSSKKKKKNNPALKEKGKEKVVGPLKKFKADKSKAQCFHCNRIGHWKRNCPIYLDEIKENKTATTG